MTEKIAVFTEPPDGAPPVEFSFGPAHLALTPSPNACNQLALIWGVYPLMHETGHLEPQILKLGEKTLLDAEVVEKDERLIMMAGRLSPRPSSSVVVWTIGSEVTK